MAVLGKLSHMPGLFGRKKPDDQTMLFIAQRLPRSRSKDRTGGTLIADQYFRRRDLPWLRAIS
jgi:hypothetical protein